ncbi:MAG: amidohydrolase [Bacillus sp. (in: Bacteria)]|nr:amidohydrolase [Bacillus sp. (in: firmicutes)]
MGTLWYGGKVRTLVEEKDIQQAVYVRDGVIQEVGPKEELVNKFNEEITDWQDLKGAVMYPGFVDSHLHMVGHGEKLLRLDISSVTSIEELKEILKERVKVLPLGTWVIGEGFNENLFPDKRIPDRYVLDEISTVHPISLSRVCRHALVVNTYGLNLAKIDAYKGDPQGGIIVRNENGNPTGYLLDQAQEYIKEIMPPIDRCYIQKAMQRSLDDLLSKGFVGAHTEDLNYYGDPIGTLTAFYELIDGKSVKFRTELLIHHEVADIIMNYQAGRENHSYVELNTIKIFADGALGGRTALLSEPYSDDPSTCGVAIHSLDELKEIVFAARKQGMPVAIHVIGDLALQYAVEAIEDYPAPENKRDRLIHLQVTRKDLLERLKKLPVVLDIQPRFVASDFPWVMDRLGEKRMDYAFSWKKLLNKGLMCAGGSDAPIEPVDPLLGIHAAVTRRKPFETHVGYLPEEKLTLYEALQLFTIGSAKAVGKESNMGLIKKGYKADFTILSDDLFDLSPDDWLRVKVAKTVVDNTVMFDGDGR